MHQRPFSPKTSKSSLQEQKPAGSRKSKPTLKSSMQSPRVVLSPRKDPGNQENTAHTNTPNVDTEMQLKLKQLEIQLAVERDKVQAMRLEKLKFAEQSQSKTAAKQQCPTIFENLDSSTALKARTSSSPRLWRKSSSMRSLKRSNSGKSDSSYGSDIPGCTPLVKHADMDTTGCVQAVSKQKDLALFRQFCPKRNKSDKAGRDTINSARVVACLTGQHGLCKDDPRLASLWHELSLKPQLTFSAFQMIKDNCLLMDRALTNSLVIPDFKTFTTSIHDCYQQVAPDLPPPKPQNSGGEGRYSNDTGTGTGPHPEGTEVERTVDDHHGDHDVNGDVARYIPSLAKVSPSLWGVAVTSVDGQQYSVGDVKYPFCIQSCSKPLTYCMALEEHGEEKVHDHVGAEPSGRNFNSKCMLSKQCKPEEITLDAHGNPITTKGIPHNPCINAGAIMVASLVKQDEVDPVTNQRTGKKVDEDARFDHVMDVWKRLAGGRQIGFQNSTFMGERATADRNFCLGYMMKEEKAFPDGVDLVRTLESYFMYCSIEMDTEAMSIVAATLANGGVCPVTNERVFKTETVQHCLSIMQVAGMYDYSGEFAFRLGFPCKSGVSGVLCVVIPGVCGIATFSPRLDKLGNSVKGIRFCHALSKLFPFHQFASLPGCHHGRDITSSSLTKVTRRPSWSTSMSGSPQNDADNKGGGESSTSDKQDVGNGYASRESDLTLLWYAAAAGDMMVLQQLAAAGVDMNIADYDRRSALHLASSEGHLDAVRYLLAIGADATYADRYGNRAIEDANREGHEEVEEVLYQHMQGRDEVVDASDRLGRLGLDNDTGDAAGTAAGNTTNDGDRTQEFDRAPVLAQRQQERCLYQGSVRWMQLLMQNTQFVSRALVRPRDLLGDGSATDTSLGTNRMMHRADLIKRLTDQGIECNINAGYITRARSSLHAQLQSLPEFFNRRCFQQICVDPLNSPAIMKCLTGTLAIPHFPRFMEQVKQVFVDTLVTASPPLPKAIAKVVSCGLCSVDGQQLHLNNVEDEDSNGAVCEKQWLNLQGLVRLVVYCLALEQREGTCLTSLPAKSLPSGNSRTSLGPRTSSARSVEVQGEVHQFVGREPRPSDATDIELNPDGRPFNPFTLGGAIMTMALIQGEEIQGDDDDGAADDGVCGTNIDCARGKMRAIQTLIQRMQGGRPCRLNTSAYRTAASPRNSLTEKGLSYMMKATGCMGLEVDELSNLDAHFMAHALESDTKGLAILAATLAAGGVCPTTGERVLSSDVVKSCLSIMQTSGMGHMSGEFQFKVGVPSCCSFGDGCGAIVMAVPNVLGVCYDGGSSGGTTATDATGLGFCSGLVARFTFHRNFSNQRAEMETGTKEDPTKSIVHWQHKRAIHIDHDDHHHHPDIQNHHENGLGHQHGVIAEMHQCEEEQPHEHKARTSTAVVTRLLSAASVGDIMAVKAMRERGCDLDCADYDMRTAAHLAATNGELEILRNFASCGVDLQARDRWGGTPLDDAEHEGHTEVAEKLRQWLGLDAGSGADDERGEDEGPRKIVCDIGSSAGHPSSEPGSATC